MAIEIELKFAAEVSAFENLLARFDDWTTYEMKTTYYDTADAKLGALRCTLRRRFENGVSVCTVKTPHKGGGRNEFELECENIMDAIPQLVAMGAPRELLAYTAEGVEEVCAARFTRMARNIALDGATAELALDRGELLGGGKSLPIFEVEVELKDGDLNAVAAYAEQLAREFGLRPEHKSKYKRALTLAGK